MATVFSLNFSSGNVLLHWVRMRFIVATKDYAGLGFAVRLQDEGHEVLLATNPGPEDAGDPERMKGLGFEYHGIGRGGR